MHPLRLVAVCRGFLLRRVAHGYERDRDDRGGKPEKPADLLDPLFPGIDTQPDGAQAQGVGGQKDVLNGGGTGLVDIFRTFLQP